MCRCRSRCAIDDEFSSRGRPCGPGWEPVNVQSGQVGCAGPASALAALWSPGIVLISALGQALPELNVSRGRALSWKLVKGLVQVQEDQKNSRRRFQPACASCETNRQLLHADVSGASTCKQGSCWRSKMGDRSRDGAGSFKQQAHLCLAELRDSERSRSWASTKWFFDLWRSSWSWI